MNLFEKIFSKISLFPGTLVKSASNIGILSVARPGKGAVLILTEFNFFIDFKYTELSDVLILYPIFFKILNSVFRCFGFIFFTVTQPPVMAATHR